MNDRREQDPRSGTVAPEQRVLGAEGTAEGEAVVFVCVTCDVPLTSPLTRLPAVPELPAYELWADQEPGPLPPTVPSGRYAIETEPYGAPLVVSEARVVPMPRYTMFVEEHGQCLVSRGPRGNIVVNPDDAHGLEYHHASPACCGATPTGGLNQRCACGTLVATLSSDCGVPYELHLSPDHVRAVSP
ncbi:hypothetical protein ACFWIN_05455 [Streptomyces sp. NPDC127049]|uniref:hypothetical protein n=1 Tax=Streptomyces sp. NPDC127049 TaxID=3347118 RepID=UPI00365E9DD6